MGAATTTGTSGGPATAGGAPDRIERRISMTNNNNSNNSNKEPPTTVRQYTKDSTKTLTSESTTGFLMREELKDDSSLTHNKVVGAGVGGMGLAMDERTYSAASGTIHFQELEYAGVTRRGSTMTTASNNTQTTYRLNVHIPPHRTDYYPEKGGYDTGSDGKSHPYNYNPINLSNLSPTATAPTTPITLRRDSLFGLAGSNNNNPAPNGKRYIDTRKRNKKQNKGEKAVAKASFKKATSLFSNERTFIHWIKFGMLLGALAMTLLNFSGDEVAKKGIEQSLANRVGQIGKNVGVTLLLICLVCLLYAAASYHWRHLGIVNDKGFERYFDRIGPTFLTVALLATYTINVVLTIQVSSLMDRDFEPSSIFLNNNNNNNNNNNLGQHSLQPLAPSPSISPPLAGVNQTESVAPPPSSPPPPTQPQRPVFDTPYLPPGSTILIDSDEDDGSDFEISHPPSDLEDPTVTTASSKTESSEEEEGSGLPSSRDDFEDSSSSSAGDEDDDDN
ncbi:hypothetical protein BGZ97_008286 [Linnemannia gamsii]|uniref:DUF202 domain-containing protein n=1 Tax=Linnemannia gamsii TaxID=64522 RepID=A0A9P6UEN8_9FUNG|nr:hypothetical protein BGZ97_008286 [Linnemannia gamsii]